MQRESSSPICEILHKLGCEIFLIYILFYIFRQIPATRKENCCKVRYNIKSFVVIEEADDMRILYEDNHVIVVEKPVMLLQADRSRDPDMVTLLKNDLKHRYNKPGNVYLGLVHRLDRPVGGAMVFAKTSKAASRLSDAVRRRRLIKRYLAVVHGKHLHKSGTLEHSCKKTDAPTRSVSSRAKPRMPNSPSWIIGCYEQKSKYESCLRTADYRKATPDPGAICPYGLSAVWRPEIRISQKPSPASSLHSGHANRFAASDTGEMMTFTSLPSDRYPWNIWPEPLQSLCEEGEANLPNR